MTTEQPPIIEHMQFGPEPSDAAAATMYSNLQLCKVCYSIHEVDEEGQCSKG